MVLGLTFVLLSGSHTKAEHKQMLKYWIQINQSYVLYMTFGMDSIDECGLSNEQGNATVHQDSR